MKSDIQKRIEELETELNYLKKHAHKPEYSKRISIIDSVQHLEWVLGPDRDTNWNHAYQFIQTLGSEWNFPSLSDMRGIYKSELPTIFKTSGSFIWTIGNIPHTNIDVTPSAYKFDINNGDWECVYKSSSERFRVFAVRPYKV